MEILTENDLQEIGEAFVGLLVAQAAMGHTSPTSTARDYVDPRELSPNARFVRDAMVAAGAFHPGDSDEAAYVRDFLERYDLHHVLAEIVARVG